MLLVASSAAGSANARSNFASPPDPTAVDEEDTFDHDHFEDPKRMRVVLGMSHPTRHPEVDGVDPSTSGWANPHDKMGSPQERQKAKQQFLNRQRQRQKQLADPLPRESDPISEDTASSETWAKLYSQLRNRSAANGCTFSCLPTRLDDDDDSGVKEEPVVEEATVPTVAVPTAAPMAAAASKSCDCDCKSLKRDFKCCDEQVRVLRLNQVVADGGAGHGREFVYLHRLALNVVYRARYGRGKMTSNVKLEILLSPEDVASLEEFAQQAETQSAQLEQRLSAMLASSIVTPIDLPASSAADTLLGRLARRWALAVVVLALVGLAVLVLVRLRCASWKARVGVSLLYFFLLSFVWHWVYTLELEMARRDAFVSRNIVPPEECSPVYSQGWLRRLTSYDQVVCDRYYEKLLVDPVWQVNPLIVALDILSRAFFHPLTFLGDYVGRFAQDFAKHQTFWSIFNNLLSLLTLVVHGEVILVFPFRVAMFLRVR